MANSTAQRVRHEAPGRSAGRQLLPALWAHRWFTFAVPDDTEITRLRGRAFGFVFR